MTSADGPKPLPESNVRTLVIGGGISGVVTAKCLKEAGLEVLCLERTGNVGGLWNYKENGYGVMKFTHINVSKHNYCFSDFPFPEDVADYPHNVDMENYIESYVKHFDLDKIIKYHTQVNSVKRRGEEWEVITEEVQEDEIGNITPTGKRHIYITKFVAIATGHHAKPTLPHFEGIETFKGQAFHSVKYKDAHTNGIVGKKIVVVGIGNSALDVACHSASVGMSKPVYLSTRSGAWVIPNYIFGRPTDHYACRFFLALPWHIATRIFEGIITIVSGPPSRWNLNPKMRALQSQPSVSPTLIHHIQRKEIKVVPNIQKISGNNVTFTDGSTVEADHIIYCTGYKIDLPFLSEDVKSKVLDDKTNQIKLFKNVFNPEIGSSLAFIGFVQPASGGILSMSETQARWFSELCKGSIHLQSQTFMEESIKSEMDTTSSRYYHSARHTIQRDPITYNDEIGSYFGVKPEFKKHPWIAWRLLLGSCGSAQWRLQGPGKWPKAEQVVRSVPVTDLMLFSVIAVIVILILFCINIISWIFDD